MAWTAFPHPDDGYVYSAERTEAGLAAAAPGRLRTVPQKGRAGERLDRLPCRRLRARRQARAGRRRRRLRGRAQGDLHLRQQPRTEREEALCAVRGSGRTLRPPKARTARQSGRLLLAGLRAGPLRAGHLDRQGAGAGHRAEGAGRPAPGDQARALPRRCAHRARRLPRRDHRHRRRDDRRPDLRRRKDDCYKCVPQGARARSRFGHRAHRIRARDADPGRQKEDGRSGASCTGRPPR